jgi:hypothetical protein
MTYTDVHELIGRYVAVWNESDAARPSASCGPRTAPTSSSHRKRSCMSQPGWASPPLPCKRAGTTHSNSG